MALFHWCQPSSHIRVPLVRLGFQFINLFKLAFFHRNGLMFHCLLFPCKLFFFLQTLIASLNLGDTDELATCFVSKSSSLVQPGGSGFISPIDYLDAHGEPPPSAAAAPCASQIYPSGSAPASATMFARQLVWSSDNLTTPSGHRCA